MSDEHSPGRIANHVPAVAVRALIELSGFLHVRAPGDPRSMSSARRTRYEVEIIGGCREVKAMAMDLLQYAVGIILAHAAPAPACDAPPPLGQSAPSSSANQPKPPAGVASPHSWSRCRPEPQVPPASQRSDRRDRWVHHPGRPVLAMRPPRWASEPPLFRYGTAP